MKAVAVLAASMLVAVPVTASATEVNYTAAEVVEFFVNSADLGPPRGICIGTAQECAAAQAQPSATPDAPAEGFDLMINFELNSDRLSESAKANLQEFSKALDDPRLAAASFVIEGHTDATGPQGFNLDLSQRRAAAVLSFLREQGVDTSRFVIRGYGQSKPRSDDPFDPVNRRVETRLILQ